MTISFIIQQLQQYVIEHGNHGDMEFEVAILSKSEDGEAVFGTKFVSLDAHEDPEGKWVTLVSE